MKNVYRSFIVPPGKYWLTDPCYVITDSADWSAYLQACALESEEYKSLGAQETTTALDCTLNGHYTALPNGMKVLSFSTHCGDGGYTDQLGGNYTVDSGLLGLVPHEYAPEADIANVGRLVDFPEETLCFTRDGILTFGNYIIDTVAGCLSFDGMET